MLVLKISTEAMPNDSHGGQYGTSGTPTQHHELLPFPATSADLFTMENDSHGGQYGTSGMPTQHHELLPFTSTSADLFGYPMSALAPAAIFDSIGLFLDPGTDMSGMDFDVMTDDCGIFNTGSHRISSSLDWRRDNQLFQDIVNTPSNPSCTTPTKRQRPLQLKAPVSETAPLAPLAPFNFNKNDGKISASGDPFSSAGLGAVDPGLLFSRHNSASSPTARQTTSHVAQQPYEHQPRESRRGQEELRRSLSTLESSTGHCLDRGTMSSPIKGHGRPPLLRGVSAIQGRKGQDRILPRTGQSSPIRRQRPSSLTSIPESLVPRPRTEVIFTIDAKGKARTETVVVGGASEPATAPRPSRNEEREFSQYESSSDDEPIIVLSRNTFFTPPSLSPATKLARFSRRLRNGYEQSESSTHQNIGSAIHELLKVLQGRKKQKLRERNSRHYRPSGVDLLGSVQYLNCGSSTTISPTTVTDPDVATPSGSETGTTRCLCNKANDEGFMIQCESCNNWLHGQCVKIGPGFIPPVYICFFCVQTPNMRGGRARGTVHPASSPLAHKSFKSFR